MSNLNLKWVVENFQEHNTTIFDIGCASLGDTIEMRRLLPNVNFYAFECNNYWLKDNIIKAKDYNINYYHIALSDCISLTEFYPSLELDGVEWPWSGSLIEPDAALLKNNWRWDKSYTVNTISIKEFCEQKNVTPDFIHIDTQGAEYRILSAMGNYKPKAIWTEISEFTNYKTNITYNEFNSMLESMNYKQIYKDNHDSLYIHNEAILTRYSTE